MTTEALVLWRLHPRPIEAISLRLPLSIGRHPASGLRLPEDDISRLHAVIEDRQGQLTLVDQGSRNGAYLHGRRVGVAKLSPGAVVRLGQTVLWLASERTPRLHLEARLAEEAPRATPLLLTGERGVGKRTIARQIHERSGRTGPLLIAAGAPADGLFRVAAGGTVLCELGDDFDVLCRLASLTEVRLIGTADRRTTTDKAAAGVIELRPLRERLDELPDALEALLRRAKAPTAWNTDFLEALACHPFPLNFGELEVVCRDLAGSTAPLGIQHLTHAVRAHVVEARSASAEDLSRERLDDALTRHRGNVRRVAQELGVQRGQLYRVLAGFGLNPDLYRGLMSPAVTALPSAQDDDRRTSP